MKFRVFAILLALILRHGDFKGDRRDSRGVLKEVLPVIPRDAALQKDAWQRLLIK